MTEQKEEKLLAYIINEMIRLESEVIDRQNAVTKHGNYADYHYELAVALIRQKAFRKFSRDVLQILGLWFHHTSENE